ncbi:hypothetical protein AZE42_00672 [Rhizopogon vesiculosus]|uniref:Uncharacterized protein n=1 Tax=Rhizopogon vesiculosus TaxID=180088 RepID=A0A1J8Q787_9AGAM|nr:hypothetical protein AZE42_00672 [Rhizopogon vesiculosus]
MSFLKLFQKSNNEPVTSSLKHSKSMPYGLSSKTRTREIDVDPLKPVYRGKSPLKASDIVYIEQAPGILNIHYKEMYNHICDDEPNHVYPDTHKDLLDQFPSPPGPPPRPSRSPLRTNSLNSHSGTPQIPSQAYNTTAQVTTGKERTMHRSPSVACFSRPTATAYPSLSGKQQRREATAAQAMQNILNTGHNKAPILGSSRQAERVRAKSQTGPSYSPAPPIPTAPSPRPMISRSAHSSRANLRRVPSQIAIPSAAAPDHGQSYWPHTDYREFLKEQDPRAIRAMINRYPVAPLHSERLPEHLRPIRFDMNDQRQFQKTLSYWIHIAIAQGRPLDARADFAYRRILEAGNPSGIVPEVGSDWSQQMEYR